MLSNKQLFHLKTIAKNPQCAYLYLIIMNYYNDLYSICSEKDNQENYIKLLEHIKNIENSKNKISETINMLEVAVEEYNIKYTPNQYDMVLLQSKMFALNNFLIEFDKTKFNELSWASIKQSSQELNIFNIPSIADYDNSWLIEFKETYNFITFDINIITINKPLTAFRKEFEDTFSSITKLLNIKNKNLGLGLLKLSFHKEIFKLNGSFNSGTMRIDIHNLYEFIHEWAHAIDFHSGYLNYPLLKNIPHKIKDNCLSQSYMVHLPISNKIKSKLKYSQIYQISKNYFTPDYWSADKIVPLVQSFLSFMPEKKQTIYFNKLSKYSKNFTQPIYFNWEKINWENITTERKDIRHGCFLLQMILNKTTLNKNGHYVHLSELVNFIYAYPNNYYQDNSEVFARSMEKYALYVYQQKEEKNSNLEYILYNSERDLTHISYPSDRSIIKNKNLFSTLILDITENNT